MLSDRVIFLLLLVLVIFFPPLLILHRFYRAVVDWYWDHFVRFSPDSSRHEAQPAQPNQ